MLYRVCFKLDGEGDLSGGGGHEQPDHVEGGAHIIPVAPAVEGVRLCLPDTPLQAVAGVEGHGWAEYLVLILDFLNLLSVS